MANIDRILRVQQSYQLAKIGAINKQMLIAQYAQCEQISMLEKKIQQSNAISRQILENQLKEIQYKEKIKYYKALAYNMGESISLISNETDPVLQVFLCDLFLEAITINIKESKDNLEDISDKSFCKDIEIKIPNIKEQIKKNRIKYQGSEFPNLFYYETDYEEKKTNLENRKIETIIQLAKNKDKQQDEQKDELAVKPYKNNSRGCGIIFLSILLLLLIVVAFEDLHALVATGIVLLILLYLIYEDREWKKNYPTYLSSIELLKEENEKKNVPIENEIINNYRKLETHPYIKTQKIISLQYPNWQKKVELIYSFLPNDEITGRDPMLLEAAKFVITNKTMSPYLLQKKLSIEYNRASKIIDELAELNIIDLRLKKVLLNDANYLELLFEKLKYNSK